MKSLIRSLSILTVVCAAGCSRPIQEQLREFGFAELLPPSTLVPPGTIVQIKQLDPLLISIVCTRESAFGADIKDKVRTSSSSTSVNSKDLEGSFSLGAEGIRGVSGSAKGGGIEKVTMTLSNVTIEELPDDVIFGALKFRTSECELAIKLRRSNHDSLTLVKSAVAGDVNYAIRYQSDVSASVRAELTKQLAANLGLMSSQTSDTNVSGTHLYWGLRDDVELAALARDTLPSTGGDQRTHLLSPGKQIVIDRN
jgi:hypothetical protein